MKWIPVVLVNVILKLSVWNENILDCTCHTKAHWVTWMNSFWTSKCHTKTLWMKWIHSEMANIILKTSLCEMNESWVSKSHIKTLPVQWMIAGLINGILKLFGLVWIDFITKTFYGRKNWTYDIQTYHNSFQNNCIKCQVQQW